jgi:2-amino-4,5-dihydroxy-6-oxo-7-(phosphooxy)heptanoate synthase
MNANEGKQIRFNRLVHPRSGNMFLVPLDHSVADGPIASNAGFVHIVQTVVANGADGVVLHKGRVRFIPSEVFRQASLVVHLSGSTAHASDINAKVLLGGVEEAVQLGADAVSVHVNVGSATEAQQLADLGRIAERCSRWGMPLLAMIYPRGPKITDPSAEVLVAHAANLAADLGADLVKTPYTGDVESMAMVVDSCPIPIITAGGVPLGDDEKLASIVDDIMVAGALGVAMGRNIFQSADVAATSRRVADTVHSTRSVLAATRFSRSQRLSEKSLSLNEGVVR